MGTGAGVGGNEVSGASSLPPDITKLHGGKKKKADYGTCEANETQGIHACPRCNRGGRGPNVNVLDEIRSNFTPRAEVASAVHKLPIEYIHRHRLIKQVVDCPLDRAMGPRDTDEELPFSNTITCITLVLFQKSEEQQDHIGSGGDKNGGSA